MTQLSPVLTVCPSPQCEPSPWRGAQPCPGGGWAFQRTRRSLGGYLHCERTTDRTFMSRLHGSQHRAHRCPEDKSYGKWRACTIEPVLLPLRHRPPPLSPPEVYPRLRRSQPSGGGGSRTSGHGAEGHPNGSRAPSSLQVSRCWRTVVGKAEHWPGLQAATSWVSFKDSFLKVLLYFECLI